MPVNACVQPCTSTFAEQLLQSGVLASWAALRQLLLQQQQQLSNEDEGDCKALRMVFGVMQSLSNIWLDAVSLVPSEVGTLAHAALPLLQQLPCYGSSSSSQGSLPSGSWAPIPAFHEHQDMLPGGQAYLATAGCLPGAAAGDATLCVITTCMLAMALETTFKIRHVSQQQSSTTLDSNAAVLSAAAVRLLLELQLLAAGAVQRGRQPHQRQPARHDQLLQTSAALLQWHLKAALQAGRSCLPPEVLQQAGLQLLQALAAPLQQVQLTASDARLRTVSVANTTSSERARLVREYSTNLKRFEVYTERKKGK
uniref:Uncharacterized protein n=1 Tax=Tetradesmus obliquus TaxID=3088 RepID=A0A383VBS5_TETOB|eukprot:jgi/Sobl393_1/5701/SZX62393.1